MNTSRFLATAIPLALLGLSGCFQENELLGEPSHPDTSGTVPAYRADTLPISVTEIASGNASLLDEFGSDPGWLEITNTSTNPVALGGYRLRGRGSEKPGWRLPDTTLVPGASFMVFASGRDLRTAAPEGPILKAKFTSAYGWSDSLNTDPAPGFSSVRPDRFPKLAGKNPDGSTAISAKMFLRDNTDAGLEWCGANVGIGFALVNATGADNFLLKGTFPAGQSLVLRLCSDNECWKRGSVTFVGTGVEDDNYLFPLSSFDADPTTLQGIQMDPPTNMLGTYSLYVSQIAFFKSARHPHTNFKLKRDGGGVVLEDTSGKVAMTTEYPAIPATGSWVRDPANGEWGFVAKPTPEKANPSAFPRGILEAPIFLSTPGPQNKPFTVKVATSAGYTTRCRIDGGDPNATSQDASAGIRLDSSASVRCALFAGDGRKGPTATATYLLGEDLHLPVVSITVDPKQMFDEDSGLYSLGPNASPTMPNFGANFWSDRELAANVELFENGQQAFSLPVGIGIYGNWTRSQPKKAISIQFREKYGATGVEWPLFPHHPQFRKFKGFGLRANGSNSSTDYVRDGMMESFAESRGLEYQLSRHVVFYINGRYWGIYEIREKLDPDFVETRFGIDKSTIDMVKNNSEVQAGSSKDWLEVRRDLEDIGANDTAAWNAFSKQIDFDAFMDYNAIEIFSQNTDWPANNVRVWRRNTPPSPWRPMLFDMDGGLGAFGGPYTKDPFPYVLDSTKDWDSYPNGAGSNVVLRRIVSNPSLRSRFINRFLVQMATNLSPTTTIRAMDSVTGSIAAEVPRDERRWKLSATKHATEDKAIRNFLTLRPDVIRSAMKSVFELDTLKNLSIAVEGGTLAIEGINVGPSITAGFFKDLPISLEAVGAPGRTFRGWSDGVTSARRTVRPGTDPWSLTAKFE